MDKLTAYKILGLDESSGDQEKIQAFIKELTVLSTSKYRYNTNAFLSAFKKHGSDDILFSPEFMTELAVLLCNAKIDSLTTQHIYKLYQTREVPPGPEYQALITVLQSHISADKTEHTMLYLLAMAFLFAEILLHSALVDNFVVLFSQLRGCILFYPDNKL